MRLIIELKIEMSFSGVSRPVLLGFDRSLSSSVDPIVFDTLDR
jgi:hypothetical protein